jgi:hypothetical protein
VRSVGCQSLSSHMRPHGRKNHATGEDRSGMTRPGVVHQQAAASRFHNGCKAKSNSRTWRDEKTHEAGRKWRLRSRITRSMTAQNCLSERLPQAAEAQAPSIFGHRTGQFQESVRAQDETIHKAVQRSQDQGRESRDGKAQRCGLTAFLLPCGRRQGPD